MTTPKNTAVAPLSDAAALPAMPDELLDITAKDAGMGVSQDPADQLLSIITVLQTNSAACDKRSSDYIDGAEPGAFWFRNDLIPIRDGDAGFVAVPCAMQTVWNEWGPTRGSGKFGRHLKQPDDVETHIDEENRSKRPVLVRRGSGNVLQHAREFFVLVDGKPYLLSFHGTGHTTARKWQTYFNQLRHPRTGAILPSFTHKYRLTTVRQNNSLGHWFGIQFADLRCVTVPEYEAAKELHAIAARGAFRIEAPVNEDDAA